MKYLNGEYYVEVKDHRYEIHTFEIIILGRRNPPTSLRFQYEVQNNTQMRKNRKVTKNSIDELEVKKYPKNKQPHIQQRKSNLPSCPSCKRKTWLEFDKGFYCKIVIT